MKILLLPLFFLISLTGLLKAQSSDPINVATYNLRFNNPADGENAWPNRKEAVKNLIRYHEFDIFGTQEGLLDQLNDLLEMKEFAYTGHGRDDGKGSGEHSAIFYRKDRFTLLKSGDFWLSETPDQPSLGWDAKIRRICSWAAFLDQKTKKEFYFFCVHFDHQGVIARQESGKVMVRMIPKIAGNHPVICVGDFNSLPDTEQIQAMHTILKDAYQASAIPPYGPVGTFNGFDINAPLKERIDFLFVSPTILVLKYGALDDRIGQRYPSDHLPVAVRVEVE